MGGIAVGILAAVVVTPLVVFITLKLDVEFLKREVETLKLTVAAMNVTGSAINTPQVTIVPMLAFPEDLIDRLVDLAERQENTLEELAPLVEVFSTPPPVESDNDDP